MADNGGVFTCAAGPIPQTPSIIRSSGGYDLYNCIVPTYLPALPHDPSAAGAHVASATDYNTAYVFFVDSTTNRITVSAPEALQPSELNKTIQAVR